MLKQFQSNVLSPSYVYQPTGEAQNRIDSFSKKTRYFDHTKSEQFLQRTTIASSTCYRDISRVLPTSPIIQKTLEEVLASYEKSVVALSGGLDSFLIVSLIHKITGRWPAVATLVSHLDDYCEYQHTKALAKKLGISELIAIETSEEKYIEELPAVIKAIEAPLYNLHPVSKWIFANAISNLGFSTCVTGDGADQLFSHCDGHDYLPLVGSLFSVSGLQLECPLYRDDLIPTKPDMNKQALRDMCSNLLPPHFTKKKKKACFTPPMDLSRYGTYPDSRSDKETVLRTTIGLLKGEIN